MSKKYIIVKIGLITEVKSGYSNSGRIPLLHKRKPRRQTLRGFCLYHPAALSPNHICR